MKKQIVMVFVIVFVVTFVVHSFMKDYELRKARNRCISYFKRNEKVGNEPNMWRAIFAFPLVCPHTKDTCFWNPNCPCCKEKYGWHRSLRAIYSKYDMSKDTVTFMAKLMEGRRDFLPLSKNFKWLNITGKEHEEQEEV